MLLFYCVATDPLTSTSVFDNSTVQLEFVVSVLQSAGVGSSHPLTVTLEYAGGVQWTHAFTLQTIAPVNVSTMLNVIDSFTLAHCFKYKTVKTLLLQTVACLE